MIGPGSVRAVRFRALTGWARDVIGAAVLTMFLLVGTGHNGMPKDGRTLDGIGYLLLVLAGVSVALCRRHPRLALVLVVIALACYLGRRYPNGPIYLAGMIVLFSLSWHARRRTTLVGAATLVITLSVVALTMRDAALTVLPLIFLGWTAASVLLGDVLRTRRAYLDSARDRARSQELTREEQTRRRVVEDRLRIARDLHDSVGHAMAMINVQAGAGAHVADRRPDAAKQALVAIQRASGDVLDELTGMLSVLREDGELAARTPTPGIAQIPALVESSASPRLRTSVAIEGPTDAIPEAVGVAAYRIVQESLTNVIRHAGATHAQVSVRAAGDRGLEVRICDDGTGTSAPSVGSGIGIRGMRERAESTGGRLAATPGQAGGFVVIATWGQRP